MNQYDEQQTKLCNRLRAYLQSVAALAVQAQELDPSGDALGELLIDIDLDLGKAQRINRALSTNDIFQSGL